MAVEKGITKVEVEFRHVSAEYFWDFEIARTITPHVLHGCEKTPPTCGDCPTSHTMARTSLVNFNTTPN